mmetsp:Transcript_39543/g.38038  ORF Transcript_39543/g.38038 Transcript_39543/m.38038 type:complete len:217 (-) Transcript_39543:475-1125(-)
MLWDLMIVSFFLEAVPLNDGLAHLVVFKVLPVLNVSLPLVDAHDHLVSVGIHVPLHQRNGLSQDIIAHTYQVHIENLVIPDYTEDPFIVVLGLLRSEGDDDPCLRLGIDRPFNLGERKHVLDVIDELKLSGQFTIIDNVKESVGVGANLDFSEVHRLVGETHIEPRGLPQTRKPYLISSQHFYLVVGAGDHSYEGGDVFNSQLEGIVWRDASLVKV